MSRRTQGMTRTKRTPATKRRADETPTRKRHARQESEDESSAMPEDVERTVGPHERSLYSIVQSSTDHTETVDEFLGGYDEDREGTTLSILQLFVEASGCSGLIPVDALRAESYKETVDALVEEQSDEDQQHCPLNQVKPRLNLSSFLQEMVAKIETNIGLFHPLAQTVIEFLTEMSLSKHRALRQTGTLAAVSMVLPLLTVKTDLEKSEATTEVQIKNEKTRQQESDESKTSSISEDLARLTEDLKELREKKAAIDQMLTSIKENVFCKRIVDYASEIRQICLEEMGKWMLSRPDIYFCGDPFLKRLGQHLCDEDSTIRTECLKILCRLADEGIDGLSSFLDANKMRLAQMIADLDMDVANHACHLIAKIHPKYVFFTAKEVEEAYAIVYQPQREWAMAAGQIIAARLTPQSPSVSANSSSVIHSSSREPNDMLQDLANVHANNKCRGDVACLVDALLAPDTVPVLRNWEAMADAITLWDHGSELNALVEILCASANQLITGELPECRAPAKKATTTNKQQKQQLAEKAKFSKELIPHLVNMLEKFADRPEQLSLLLDIPMNFDLPVYLASSQNNEYARELAQHLQRIMVKSTDQMVLFKVARLFFYLGGNIEVSKLVDERRERVASTMNEDADRSLKRMQDEDAGPLSPSETNNLVLPTLRRLAAFSTIFLSDDKVWEVAEAVLESPVLEPNEELIDRAIRTLYNVLSWSLKRALLDGNIEDRTTDDLVKKRDKFIKLMKDIIYAGPGTTGLETAFIHTCEMLLMHTWKLRHHFVDNEQKRILGTHLALKLHDDFNSRLVSSVIELVFSESDRNKADEEQDEFNEDEDNSACRKKERLLAHYVKLIIYGVLPVIEAGPILQYYTGNASTSNFHNFFKLLFNKCRELDNLCTAKAVALAMTMCFEELQRISPAGVIDQSSKGFNDFKNLAIRLSSLYGTDPPTSRNREAIVIIHKDGIDFALDVKKGRGRRKVRKDATQSEFAKVLFLGALQEFSSKLSQQDKISTRQYLVKHCPLNPEPDDDECRENSTWQSYVSYKESLQQSQGKRGK